MQKTPDLPRSLHVSMRLYQVLLGLYPRAFRTAYGSPMQQLFRDCCRRALRDAGAAGLMALWMQTIHDTVKTAIEEHSQRGVDMSKETFFKVSGWAMIVGPLLFLAGAWANNRPAYSIDNMASLPIDRYAVPAATPLMVVGMLFMSLGLLAVLMRYAPKWETASVLLLISILGGLASTVGVIMLSITDSSPWWETFMLGLAVHYLALAFFGFVALRRKLLPRWNGLPILALWFPIAMLLSIGLIPWEFSSQMLAALWLLSCVLFAGLGYLLKSDTALVPSAGAA